MAMITHIMIITLLLPALLLPVQSFLLQPAHLSRSSSSSSAIGGVQKNQNNANKFSTQTQWMSSDDDDDYIDEDSLGDWRSFRMNLANSVASGDSSSGGVTSSSIIIDGIDLSDDEFVSSQSTETTTTNNNDQDSPKRPKSVSKQNEELLEAQNSALAQEYLNGVWAHDTSSPEVGGLVCRMPLELEIYRGSPDSYIYKRLHKFLESDEYDRTEDVSTTAAATQRRQGSSSSSKTTPSMSFSVLAAKTVFWYRGAEKLLKKEMMKIMSVANANGRIDPSDLDEESLELLQLYMDHQSTWQEVCLVTEMDGGGSKTLTINRPMAFKLSKSMARLVLMGAYQASGGGGDDNSSQFSITRKEKNGGETQNLVKFLTAFENQCAVYVGGPDDMDKPAVLVHGIAELPGAVEISKGTGIYQGGLDAGEYTPLLDWAVVCLTPFIRECNSLFPFPLSPSHTLSR